MNFFKEHFPTFSGSFRVGVVWKGPLVLDNWALEIGSHVGWLTNVGDYRHHLQAAPPTNSCSFRNDIFIFNLSTLLIPPRQPSLGILLCTACGGISIFYNIYLFISFFLFGLFSEALSWSPPTWSYSWAADLSTHDSSATCTLFCPIEKKTWINE